MPMTYGDDVEEVVVSERVQYGGDRLPGDGQPQALHAATHIHEDHHVFGGRGRLNVPDDTTMARCFRARLVLRSGKDRALLTTSCFCSQSQSRRVRQDAT